MRPGHCEVGAELLAVVGEVELVAAAEGSHRSLLGFAWIAEVDVLVAVEGDSYHSLAWAAVASVVGLPFELMGTSADYRWVIRSRP